MKRFLNVPNHVTIINYLNVSYYFNQMLTIIQHKTLTTIDFCEFKFYLQLKHFA